MERIQPSAFINFKNDVFVSDDEEDFELSDQIFNDFEAFSSERMRVLCVLENVLETVNVAKLEEYLGTCKKDFLEKTQEDLKKIGELTIEKQGLFEKINDLQEIITENSNTIAKLTLEKTSLETKTHENDQKIEKLKQKNKETTTEFQKKSDELEKTLSKNREISTKYWSTHDNFNKAKEEKDHIETKFRKLEKDFSVLEFEKTRLSENFNQQQAQTLMFQEKIKELLDEIKKLKLERKTDDSNYQAILEEKISLDNKLRDTELLKNKIEKNLKVILTEKEKLSKTVEKLETQRLEIFEQAKTLQEEVKRLTTQKSISDQQYNEASEEFQKLLNSKSKVETELRMLLANKEALWQDLHDAKDEISELKKNETSYKKATKELKEVIETKEKAIDFIKKLIFSGAKELQGQVGKIFQTATKVYQDEAPSAGILTLINSLSGLVSSLEERVKRSESYNDQLSKDKTGLKDVLTELENQVRQCASDGEKSTGETLREIISELEDKRRELDTLKLRTEISWTKSTNKVTIASKNLGKQIIPNSIIERPETTKAGYTDIEKEYKQTETTVKTLQKELNTAVENAIITEKAKKRKIKQTADTLKNFEISAPPIKRNKYELDALDLELFEPSVKKEVPKKETAAAKFMREFEWDDFEWD